MRSGIDFYFDIILWMLIIYIAVGFICVEKMKTGADDYYNELMDAVELTDYDYEFTTINENGEEKVVINSSKDSKTLTLLSNARENAAKHGWTLDYTIMDGELDYVYENGSNGNPNVNDSKYVTHCIEIKLRYNLALPILNISFTNTRQGYAKSYY